MVGTNHTGCQAFLRAAWKGIFGGLFLSALCFPPTLSAEGPPVNQLSPERTETIIKALIERDWNPKKIIEERMMTQPPPPTDVEQLRLWQGNSPQVDMGFMDFTLDFHEGVGEKARKLQFSLDMATRYLRAKFSDTIHPWFRGGATFEDIHEKRVVRLFLPGKENKGLLLFVPPLARGDDFYLLACPREVKVRDEQSLKLHNLEWKPDAMLFHVFGHVKARLLSGTSSGEIEASIEQSPGIPAPKEAKDLAHGRNPQVELIYRPESTSYPPQPIPESGERAERFLMSVDMRLPSGNRRKTTEGFNFWVKKIQLPETEVAIPFRTVGMMPIVARVSRLIRQLEKRQGVASITEAGPCMLLVGERTEPERILSKGDSSEESQAGE